jgi:hypothetical protein
VIPDPIDIGDVFDDVDWNILGAWFTGVATLLGAIGTVTAVVVALYQAKLARDAAVKAQATADAVGKAALEEKKRALASRVYGLIHRADGKTRPRIGNGSDLPIYNVCLYWALPTTTGIDRWEDMEEAINRGDLPVSGSTPARDLVLLVPAVQPHCLVEVLYEIPKPVARSWAQVRPQDRVDTMSSGMEIVFTDGATNVWTRRRDGRLEPASADPTTLPSFKRRLGRPIPGATTFYPFVSIEVIDKA